MVFKNPPVLTSMMMYVGKTKRKSGKKKSKRKNAKMKNNRVVILVP